VAIFPKEIHNYPDALYIVTFILAIDFGLNFAFEKNLLTFDWSQLTLGIIVVFLAIYIFFTLTTNILLALFRYLLLFLFSSKIGEIMDFFKSNYIQDNNYKKLSTLHDETMKEQNDFKLKVRQR
jgi:chromate transport protein ChrA